jgi:MFS family permease
MTIVDGFKAALSVSLRFSGIALLIALVPSLLVTLVAARRRWHYAVAGLLGGVAGGFSGAASLFLSFWFACRGQVQGCNTAQGDMGLIVVFPLGSFVGSLLGLLCTRLYSGPRPFRNWTYAIASQLAFWAAMIVLFARIMAD